MRFIVFILFILTSISHAAFEHKNSGASNVGLSLSGIASSSPDFAVFNNPALISGEYSVDLFYRNYFGINELNQIALATELNLFKQPFALGVIRYGNKLYAETEIAFGSSFRIGETVFLGLAVHSNFLEIKNYGSTWTFGLNFAMMYLINDQIRLAGMLSNFNEPEIGASGEKIPLSGSIGLSYLPIPDMELLIDSYKEDYFDFAYRLGTRIKVIKNINILAGFQNSINSFSAGLEILQNNYAIKYSVDIHPVLNASHAIGIKYVF